MSYQQLAEIPPVLGAAILIAITLAFILVGWLAFRLAASTSLWSLLMGMQCVQLVFGIPFLHVTQISMGFLLHPGLVFASCAALECLVMYGFLLIQAHTVDMLTEEAQRALPMVGERRAKRLPDDRRDALAVRAVAVQNARREVAGSVGLPAGDDEKGILVLLRHAVRTPGDGTRASLGEELTARQRTAG